MQTQYHLFVWDSYDEVGYGFDSYKGTFTDLNKAYLAIPNPQSNEAQIAVTQEDGSLKQVATFVREDKPIGDGTRKLVLYRWRFEGHDVEVDRRRLHIEQYPAVDSTYLVLTGAAPTRWIEDEGGPF